MKPLAAVATSFVAMKLIFSHSRKKKGLQSLDEVGLVVRVRDVKKNSTVFFFNFQTASRLQQCVQTCVKTNRSWGTTVVGTL